MYPNDVMAIVLAAIVTSGVTIAMVAQAWATRHSGASPKRLEQIENRLIRIENAIDTVAVEVERISEAQRFSARLLAGRAENLAPVDRQAGRVTTPH